MKRSIKKLAGVMKYFLISWAYSCLLILNLSYIRLKCHISLSFILFWLFALSFERELAKLMREKVMASWLTYRNYSEILSSSFNRAFKIEIMGIWSPSIPTSTYAILLELFSEFSESWPFSKRLPYWYIYSIYLSLRILSLISWNSFRSYRKSRWCVLRFSRSAGWS